MVKAGKSRLPHKKRLAMTISRCRDWRDFGLKKRRT